MRRLGCARLMGCIDTFLSTLEAHALSARWKDRSLVYSLRFTCKYDGVEAGLPPKLHEVDHVPKPEGRMPREQHTRLSEVMAEVSVDAAVVLQLIGLNELKHNPEQRNMAELQKC